MMKKMLWVMLSVPLMLSCGGKKEKTGNASAPAAENAPAANNAPAAEPMGKPAEIKKEVEDIQQMREQEIEKRIQEVGQ